MRKARKQAAVKSSKTLICSIEDCTEQAKIAGLCAACYAGMRYWMKKTPGKVIKRQQQLKRLEARLDVLTPAQVTPIRRKRAAGGRR